METLRERNVNPVDADTELQAIKLQRYEADRERVRSRRLEARTGRKQNKKAKKKNRAPVMSKEQRQQMKQVQAKYPEYFQQQEMERLTQEHRGEQTETDGHYDGPNVFRLKRSAELPDSQNEESPIVEGINTEGEEPHLRKKRLAFTIPASLWPYGKVPYIFDDEYPEKWKFEVKAAMKIYEDLTPIRFLPHSSAVVTEVGHSNKLIFLSVEPASCWSYVGYLGDEKQNISCYRCGIMTCGHEIGHALGLEHEHQSTLRNTVEEIRYENVPPYLRFNYDIVEGVGHDPFDRVDLDSLMHYELNMQFPSWTVNYQPQIVLYDEDLVEIVDWSHDETFLFYSLKDINEYYKQLPSLASLCPSEPVCSNDGYMTKFRGHTCKCICPQGLNSNCDQLERDDQALKTASWPLGFALLKPPDGCPPGFHEDGYTQFKSTYVYAEPEWPGEPTQYVWGPDQTTSSDDFWQMRLDFCVRNDSALPDTQDFGPGDYCIIKDGVCPPGFSQEGSWQFHDLAGTASNSSGHFPSGTYDGDVVIVEFCCRMDGSVSVDLELPSDRPFILPPNAMKACQSVKGMQAELSAFYYDNKIDGYEPLGEHPHAYKYQNIPLFAFFACYYTPVTYDGCGDIFTLDENNPFVNFMTPNYPNDYPVNTRCTWVFKSPENTRMVLKFTDFDIQVGADGNADDVVEIRNNLLANQGLSYCGYQIKRSWVTYKNVLAVYFFSNAADTKTGFNGTVRMITDADMCYSGKGENYDGTRSYTRKFKKCISWAEAKANNCTHTPYEAGDINDNLEENYCRNPGSRDRPWCYYDADGCLAEFCDVCNLENCYDFHNDCNMTAYKEQFCAVHSGECENYCGVCDINDPNCVDTATDCETKGNLRHSDEASFCAETCGECTARLAEVQGYPLACDPPVQLPDAEPYQQAANNNYPLGATVSFTCSADPSLPAVTQTCSTTGNWIPKLKHACGYDYVCSGSSEFSFEMDTEAGKRCYELLDYALFTYAAAKNECMSQGGNLATEKDSETTQALNNSIPSTYKLWLGLDDIANEGIFTWVDGASLEYSNWAPGNSYTSQEPYSYKPHWTGQNTFYASVTWSKTWNGIDCVAWSSVSRDYLIDANFPVDGSVEAAGSNCRDPSKSGYLWCFTAVSWEHCDLAKHLPADCSGEVDETAYYGSVLTHYRGSVNQTNAGITCARWDGQNYYHDDYFTSDGYNRTNAENYCRSLGYYLAWCYTDLTTWSWGACDVPSYCGGDGFNRATDYIGTVSFTDQGYDCMRWDVAIQYSPGFWLENVAFSDGSISAAENFCRGFYKYDTPWCYFYQQDNTLYWNYCPVPLAEDQQDCVTREGGLWYDSFCDEMRYAVCEKPPTVQRAVCEDQHDDCALQFEKDPTLCTEYPDWADILCTETCGSCSDSNPNQPNTGTCPTPQDTGNFQIVSNPSTLTVGLYVEYKCNAQHALQSGNLLRGCTVSGTLSGSPPVCLPFADMELWNNDLSMRERYKLESSQAVYLGDNELMRIEKAGQVVAWRLYSMAPGDLELYVFRRVTPTSNFIVVGKTVVEPIADKRKKTIELPPEQRFQVQAGDVIGWGFFSSYPGGIPYDKCKVGLTKGGNVYMMASATPLTVEEEKTFTLVQSTNSDAPCHVYSLAVKVGPVPSGP